MNVNDHPDLKFSIQEVEEFCQEHMRSQPTQIVEYLQRLNTSGAPWQDVQNIFFAGLLTGVVNAIASICGGEVTGMTMIDPDQQPEGAIQ